MVNLNKIFFFPSEKYVIIALIRKNKAKKLYWENSCERWIYSLYVKTLTGKTLIIKANLEDKCLSVKEKVAELMGEGPQEYHEFEYYTGSGALVDSLRLIFAGKQLEDARSLRSYNLEDEHTLQAVLRFSHRNYDIKIMCIANNVKFTTYLGYNDNKPYTVGELKAKLLQFTSLPSTKLYLKKQGTEEFYELENDAAVVPLKDVYATLDGDLLIEPRKPRTDNLHLYSTEDGGIISDLNDDKAYMEGRYADGPNTTPFFSKPKPESIVKLEPGQSLIDCVGKINAPSIIKPSSQYNFTNAVIYAISGGGSALFACYTPMSSHRAPDRSLYTVAAIVIASAVVGAIIGVTSSYIYEQYFKAQDITYDDTSQNRS